MMPTISKTGLDQECSLETRLKSWTRSQWTAQEAFQITWGVVLGVFSASDCVQFGLRNTSIPSEGLICTVQLNRNMPLCDIIRDARSTPAEGTETLDSFIAVQQSPTSIDNPVSRLIHRRVVRMLIEPSAQGTSLISIWKL